MKNVEEIRFILKFSEKNKIIFTRKSENLRKESV